jgi:hypothetical protein
MRVPVSCDQYSPGVAQKWVWCDSEYRLASVVFPTETLSSYQTSFTANISMAMVQ